MVKIKQVKIKQEFYCSCLSVRSHLSAHRGTTELSSEISLDPQPADGQLFTEVMVVVSAARAVSEVQCQCLVMH